MTNVSRVWPSHCSFFALQSATSLPTHCDTCAISLVLPLSSSQLPLCLRLDNSLVRHQAVLVPSKLTHRHQHSCSPPLSPFLFFSCPPPTTPLSPDAAHDHHKNCFVNIYLSSHSIRQTMIEKVQARLRVAVAMKAGVSR